MQTRREKRKIALRAMLWAWGIVLSCLFVFLSARTDRVVAAEPEPSTIEIGSVEDFAAYSLGYSTDAYHPKDTLVISLQSGLAITDNNFISLGTESRPFAGTLQIPEGGIDTFYLYECPLFNYVTTDLTITGGGTVKIQREELTEPIPSGVLTSGALFAEHVVAGTNAANWSISFEGATASSFGGLIGSIADGCDVTVTFTNATNVTASGSGNIGLICGTLGDGASLAVTTAGSGSSVSVSSTGGHAGGIVGKMGNDAILTLNSANNSRVTNVSTSYGSGYAGGIVGYVSGVTTSTGIKRGAGVVDYTVSGQVTGGAGAGGLFGYYRSNSDGVSFSLQNTYNIASGTRVSSSGNTGGVFGYLLNYGNSFAFNGNATGSEVFTVTLAGGTARGGVAGKYSTDALSNVLSITNTNFTITANAGNTASRTIGGLVGQVADASPYAPAYISINGTNVITSNGTGDGNAPGGGLVGDAGTGGSFIDVSGNVTVSGRFYAGLVAKLSEGVLRIAGTTDLSAFRRHGGSGDLTAGTIVQTRGRSLIYSLGSGEGNGWVLKRNTSFNNMIDDVNTWGEVLRLDGTTLTESGLFTVDSSAHTVTVASGVTEINDEAGFAKTALNIQLGTAAGKGALLFETSNQSATLLGATLTLGADIDLTGTGLTGMTRDDGGEVTIAQNKKVMMPTSAAFTGTFNGNGHTLTVATGEVWGLTSSEASLPASSTEGMIRRHRFIGLFANTDGATFSNLTLNGYYHFILDIDPTFIGGLSAYSTGGLDLTGVTVSGLSFDYYLGANYTAYIGGAVAYALGDGLDVSVTGGSYRPTMTDTSAAGRTSGSAGDKISYVGGVIGFVNEGTGQSIEFDDTTIGITFTKTVNTQREPYFGAAIGATSNQAYVKDNRTITLTDVDVMMSANAAAAAGKEYGGILGTSWLSADVTIDGVDVVSASITESNSAATNFGGLVHTATGHWDVQDLSVTSANFDVTATGSTFGMIANRAYSTLLSNETALYLELNDANYDIDDVTFTGSTGNFSSFDEVVANTRFNTRDIVRNGNAVVSIKTSGNVVNTTGSQNTYLNKTAYGQSAVGAANPDARYYYNVAHAVTNIGTDPKYNLYAWSVKQYAHSTLSAWFGSPLSTFAGTIDLTGISYYPVDLSANVTFSSATVKLDNIKMEGFVKKGYSGDGSSRTTRSASQHYLMHAALFLNATGDITATGSPAGLKLQGNVPKISNDICGFLVAGTFGGTDNPSPTVLDVTDLVLDGVYVSNGDNHFTDTTYAPLLVNKASRNTTVTLDGVTAPNYGSDLAASSLLGDMGNSTAHGVHLTFTRIVLDGRKSTSTDLTASVSQDLDDAYDTSRSIFSRATLLNSFLYAGESSGTYTFTIDEDWDTSTGDPIHHVTYGYEITTSLEHAGKQNKYSGSTTIFTDPSAHDNDDTDSVYDFTAYFQRYVYVAANPAEYKHELAVNITYSSTISGFGKYDQPFLIDSGEKLKIIAKIIKGDDVTSSVKINLPGDLTGYNYQTTGYGEYLYSFSTSTYTSSDGGAPSMVNANVRRYLAGAYYAITDDITLSSDYEALGQTTAANPEYAFHGVILGSGGAIRKITNTSTQPLVYSSVGSVFKDLVVHVATDVSGSHEIRLSSDNTTYQYASGQTSYGALVRQVLGGDNVIDDVKVTFDTSAETAVTFAYEASGSNRDRLIPIGGYIGTLVNGGVIFRNVTSAYVGLTAATTANVTDAGYLYVNPIIGRVLAGYAFREADDYAVTSAFSNGTKNYVLSDLDDGLAKLSITNSSSQYTITVPNGQAMYVLGAIVNSGAASATYNASTEQAYDGMGDEANDTFWQAYRICTATRAGATYDYVGTLNPASDPASAACADYTAAGLDRYDMNGTHSVTKKSGETVTLPNGDLKGIPYIIRTYTAKNGNVYYARTLTRRTNNKISITNNINVAAGFRGIGSIYTDATSYGSDRVHLGIDTMYGSTGSTTITLHMTFNEYDASVTSYRAVNANTHIPYEAAVPFGSNAGFGLFNRLYQTGSTNYIENFTLSGDLYYGLRDVSDGSALNLTYDNLSSTSILNVGALAGTVYTNNTSSFQTSLRVRNVTITGLTVTGPKYAGGLVGCFANTVANADAKYKSYVTNCPVSTTTVTAGQAAGSYFGYANVAGNQSSASSARLIISGDTTLENGVSRKTTIAPTAITATGSCPAGTWLERISPTAGGVIGCADVAFAVSGNYFLVIQHIKVVGGTFTAARSSVTDFGTRSKTGLPSAAGIIGKIRAGRTSVTDCEVLHVDLNADVTGGVLGYAVIPKNSSYDFERILIDGDKGNSTVAAMTARVHAGGIVGEYYSKNPSNYTFADLTIRNYSFVSEYVGDYGTAGGVIGHTYIEANNNKAFQFRNIEVTGCTMTVDTTGVNYTKHKGVGGLFGALQGNSNNAKYTGYNFLVNNVTFAGSGTANAGAVVGNNISNTARIQLVGVSADVDPGTKTLTWTENNNSGYSAYANYSQATANTAFTALSGAGMAAVAAPYATVNPVCTIGGLKIVGDGVSDEIANLPIQSILAGYAADSKRYAYAASAYYTGGSGITNYTAFNNEKSGAIIMFSDEAYGYDGDDDFPVILIETTNEDDSHRLINSYIRLLTNTTFNFGTDVAGQFEVAIYKMAYDDENEVFVLSSGDASLKRTGGKFRMINSAYDSGKAQCSLIDVRFFDPSDGTTVAYHLYIPVFIKKVLTFDFDVAALSGTNYLEGQYTSLFGQRLIANVGAPITLYFRYTYSRTAAEWESAINNGEPLLRHYGKELILHKANNNEILKDFDEGKQTETILVLVDKNDGGRPYYAKLSDALSDDVIDLSVFRSSMRIDGNGDYVFSGAYFIPLDFSDMLSYTASVAVDGSLVACTPSEATVRTWQGYRLATSAELANGGIDKYALSASVSADGTYVRCPVEGAQIVISGYGYCRATAAQMEDNGTDKYAITASVSGEGTYVACAAGSATVRVYGQGYRSATDEELGDNEIDKYTVTVDAIPGGELVEKYYLSIFTDDGEDLEEEGEGEEGEEGEEEEDKGYNLFHYFYVTTPQSLNDGVTYPARVMDPSDLSAMIHLVMGKIFDHSDLTIVSTSRYGSAVLMTSGGNDALIVSMSVQIGLSESLGALRNEVKGYVAATGFYQSFLVYLTRNEGSSQTKAILGNPTASGGYAVDYVMNGEADVALGNYANANIHVTQIYAEFVTGNLGPAFAGEGNYVVEINAEVMLEYLQAGAVLAQFPGRNGNDDDGVTLSASSNIAFSAAATSYSKNSINREEDNPVRSYYSEAEVDNATIALQPFGDRQGDYTPYGINALNDPPETLEIFATMDFTPIYRQVNGHYTSAVVTATLRQKQNDGSYSEYDLTDIDQYITSFYVGEYEARTTGEHPKSYSATIPAGSTTVGAVSIEFPHIYFSVKTFPPGSDPEFEGFYYGNYRLTVTIVLLDEHGDEIAASKASDYVIYTNAKVRPSYIPAVVGP